jgi:hypothetical protein
MVVSNHTRSLHTCVCAGSRRERIRLGGLINGRNQFNSWGFPQGPHSGPGLCRTTCVVKVSFNSLVEVSVNPIAKVSVNSLVEVSVNPLTKVSSNSCQPTCQSICQHICLCLSTHLRKCLSLSDHLRKYLSITCRSKVLYCIPYVLAVFFDSPKEVTYLLIHLPKNISTKKLLNYLSTH